MTDQLQRIMRGLFPSPSHKYIHLVLDKSCRLSGPHAAMVQGQLETISDRAFAGARAPLKRLSIKSPDILLQEFPMARPKTEAVRAEIMTAYGVGESLLAKLVDFQKQKMEARSSRRAVEATTQDGSEYDEL